MATLETTLLIQSALTPPATTTAVQPKPAEGFQRLLDAESGKLRNPAPQAKPAAVATRTMPMASQPVSRCAGKRESQPETDSDLKEIDGTEKAVAEVAKSQCEEVPAKVGQTRDSEPEGTEGLVEGEAESAEWQVLPGETVRGVEVSWGLAPEKDREKSLNIEDTAPVVQSTLPAALLTSLLSQNTGDLKLEVEPPSAELPTAPGPMTHPVTVQAGPSVTGGGLKTPFMSGLLDGAAPAKEASPLPTGPGEVMQESPIATLMQDSGVASAGTASEKQLLPDLLGAGLIASHAAPMPVTIQEVVPVQNEAIPQAALYKAVAQTEEISWEARPATLEKQERLGKGIAGPTGQAKIPGLEVSPELLTSRFLSQPSAWASAESTPQNDGSSSTRQDAEPDPSETVHGLKAAVIPAKESLVGQFVVSKIDEVKENVAHQVTEPAFLPDDPGAPAQPSHETAFHGVVGPESTSSVLSVPPPLPLGVAEATGKAVGASHANSNWSQVEKAQLVSQIVERAHLLGQKQSELMVVLKPEFLGKVNLHAAMVDNQLVATIVAESASVKQMLESQISSLQTALHEQGLPVAKVEIVQGSQLSFADLGAGQSSSQQQFESGKPQSPLSFPRYETHEETTELAPLEVRNYASPTSHSLNLVA